MFECRVTINGNVYEYIVKDKKAYLLRNKDGIISKMDANLLDENSKKTIVNKVVEQMLEDLRKEIEEKISNGKYADTSEIEKDIQTKVSSIDVSMLTNKSLQNNFENLNKEMKANFEALNNDVEKKTEIVQEHIDVDLETIFKENGIAEYDIDKTASVIVYYKDNIPHIINNINGNQSIYKELLKNINIDKMTSKESLDAAIMHEMDVISETQYTSKRALSQAELSDGQSLDDIKDNLGSSSKVYGLNPNSLEAPLTDDKIVLADKNGDGKANLIFDDKIAQEKRIDNSGNVEKRTIQSSEEQQIQKNIKDSVSEQTNNLLVKCYKNENLTEEELNFIESYYNEDKFATLSPDLQQKMLELQTMTEKPKEKDLQQDGHAKTLGVHPETEHKNFNSVSSFLITFCVLLSGLAAIYLNILS